jgi:hypothetical protein
VGGVRVLLENPPVNHVNHHVVVHFELDSIW